MERGRQQRQDRPARLLGQLPDRHHHLLQQPGHRRPAGGHGGPVRDLLVQRQRPGAVEPALRQQLQRLGHVRRCLPPAVRDHHQPRLDGVQRARLLGDQLGWGHRGGELPVRQQPGRLRHQHPDQRGPAGAAERQLPEQRRSAPSPTPTRAGCSCTTTCTTTTTPTCPRPATPPPGPPAPA